MNFEEKILESLNGINSRLDRVDNHLNTLTGKVNELDARTLRTAVMVETEALPKINALFDGHNAIMEQLNKLATKDRVDELESDIVILKTAVKMLSQEVAELKKAQ